MTRSTWTHSPNPWARASSTSLPAPCWNSKIPSGQQLRVARPDGGHGAYPALVEGLEFGEQGMELQPGLDVGQPRVVDFDLMAMFLQRPRRGLDDVELLGPGGFRIAEVDPAFRGLAGVLDVADGRFPNRLTISFGARRACRSPGVEAGGSSSIVLEG